MKKVKFLTSLFHVAEFSVQMLFILFVLSLILSPLILLALLLSDKF